MSETRKHNPTVALIKEVNRLLKEGEPFNVTTDHKGNSGYMPQAVIDSINAVNFGAWGFEEISSAEVIRTDKVITYVSQVRVWLSVEGVKLPFQPTAWGDGTQPLSAPGDAAKSAQTDALKKALSYFSIGNRAYHGKLPPKT